VVLLRAGLKALVLVTGHRSPVGEGAGFVVIYYRFIACPVVGEMLCVWAGKQ
jgi:hypothetical protein